MTNPTTLAARLREYDTIDVNREVIPTLHQAAALIAAADEYDRITKETPR